jgi:hypothetical protein
MNYSFISVFVRTFIGMGVASIIFAKFEEMIETDSWIEVVKEWRLF